MDICLADLNYENASPQDAQSFQVRTTVRAVIFDDSGDIALIVAKEGYAKLPGGGVEKGEGHLEALGRECLEEVGVSIKDIEQLGFVREVKKESAGVQISHAYVARVAGEKHEPQFTKEETEKGFSLAWMGLDDAITLIRQAGYKNLNGRYVMERELTILKTAQEYRYD